MKFTETLFSIFAHKSHIALTTAAVAMWMTPFSGPTYEMNRKNVLSLIIRHAISKLRTIPLVNQIINIF